ncbi:1-(5-phosphoribosyl)-5-((5-phosphoribosylamino)methylideneamino)imidazole-4-carboxamide isomerase [Thermogymnomonas acidicola]|uniref:1-(5-phosphoribosyl)-5-[(5-phosphoribosylamino)methylideneamino] imidazole-4-carboxamide isomerase n=1 Tax=Thermogymnomonas acidicola TaxID=399579 RepID=A0AA37F9U2_9ARCH|nr:1-(5-phosphoribosyl)-5-((5-phosphoribosylamino)methylideneamino)imidazole-4-carboxamide isomerase [Thermogymnomonas acidicola]GGM75905.1 1-(5-phosphoribosyl)-5-((5-phosphoribosylamino)methylideneamino)imidazole-4-carboxamide isomerase [Thermogymnomonas acidicola]
MRFRVFPAVDILNGRAVRLYRGMRERATDYGDPVEVAERFASVTGTLHIIDLDGAFTGSPKNMAVVKRIVDRTGAYVQVGGGFRRMEAIEEAYSTGVRSVILGTAAQDLDFVREVVRLFPDTAVSLDSRGGLMATNGWTRVSGRHVSSGYSAMKGLVRRFIYTSVDRDGTMAGVETVERFWADEDFIYAGGVTTADDVLRLIRSGFTGCIIGKALYEGTVDLKSLGGL